jgi:hypothetical protein
MTKQERAEKIVLKGEQTKALKSRFRGKLGKAALALLEDYGFYSKSTYVPMDRDATHVNEGCRRMVLKIHEALNMSDEEIDRQIENKLKSVK